jgi:ABC-2 type transport system permease protein
MLLSYLAYFGVFIGISLAVSAKAKTSSMSLVILLAFWILNGLIAPRAVADLARQVYPTPSAFDFQQTIDRAMRSGPDGHQTTDQRAAALKARVLKQYGVETVEALPINFAGLSLQESEEHGNVVFDQHYGALWRRFESQNRIKQLAAVVAPMLAIQSLSMGLAGTDFAHHRDFASAAEQYRRQLVRKMNDHLTYEAVKKDFSYLAPPELWQTVEEFEYTAPPTSWILRQQALSLALLLLWGVSSLAAAIWIARRSLHEG